MTVAGPSSLSPLRVQFVHDWLTGFRGGEKVLLELVRMFPNSTIATLLHVPGSTVPELDSRVTATSFLQKLPRAATAYRNYLPLFPRAVRSLVLDKSAEMVISVSHAVAKGIKVPAGKPHICYCNTPMRYIWGMEDQYLSKLSPKRLALAAAKPALRRFDRQNQQVTQFIANSQTVGERIRRIYDRDATVVYPGIDETYYVPPALPPTRDFYLVISALVPYKRIELAIDAVLPTPHRRLVIIGGGPELAKLQKRARNAPHITFLGRAADDVLLQHYQNAKSLLFPGEEDFGLTPVEAQACGTPVIAYQAGGATETVIAPNTGLFFNKQTSQSLSSALDAFETGSPPDSLAARTNALRFTWTHFRAGVHGVVARVLAGSLRG